VIIAVIINYVFRINFVRFTSPCIVNGLQHGGKLYVRADIKTRRILSTECVYGLLTILGISINPACLRNAEEVYLL
jgi:hypothetical protein